MDGGGRSQKDGRMSSVRAVGCWGHSRGLVSPLPGPAPCDTLSPASWDQPHPSVTSLLGRFSVPCHCTVTRHRRARALKTAQMNSLGLLQARRRTRVWRKPRCGQGCVPSDGSREESIRGPHSTSASKVMSSPDPHDDTGPVHIIRGCTHMSGPLPWSHLQSPSPFAT